VEPAPNAALTPTPRPAAAPSPGRDPETVRAAFIGDSYTQGGGADPDEFRWSTEAAGDLGWSELNYGRGGTGYVTTNSFRGCGLQYCPTYVEMVAEVAAVRPDVVVVAGGQNDFSAYARDPSRVHTAVRAVFAGLRAALPDARLVALGPSTPWAVDDLARGLDHAVREAAASVDALYVSLLEPNVVDPAHHLGDGHVDNRGHRAIADRLVAAVRADAVPGVLDHSVAERKVRR
jgi:lysophospholipase L1-like esterase